MEKYCNEEQLLHTKAAIQISFSGCSKENKLRHSPNMLVVIVEMSDGHLIFFKEVQYLNAPKPMLSIPSVSCSSFNGIHILNAA